MTLQRLGLALALTSIVGLSVPVVVAASRVDAPGAINESENPEYPSNEASDRAEAAGNSNSSPDAYLDAAGGSLNPQGSENLRVAADAFESAAVARSISPVVKNDQDSPVVKNDQDPPQTDGEVGTGRGPGVIEYRLREYRVPFHVRRGIPGAGTISAPSTTLAESSDSTASPVAPATTVTSAPATTVTSAPTTISPSTTLAESSDSTASTVAPATTVTSAPATTIPSAPATTIATAPTTTLAAFRSSSATSLSGVPIRPGESIQAAVDAHPSGTTFVLKAGVHRGQEVRPKAGNVFVGEPGAVLDGEGRARWAFSSGARNVVIRGLVIQNYASPRKEGAINRAGGAGWVVEGNEVRNNTEVGIRAFSGWRVVGNYVHHNGRYGISGGGTNLVVEGNEITQNALVFGRVEMGHSSATKFVQTVGLVLRNNYVHHNEGNGLWADINNVNTLFEGNRVVGNTRSGISFEISCGAVVRNNYLEGNGFLNRAPNWMNDSAIVVSTSSNVEIYGNTVVKNNKGIGLIHADRSDSPTVASGAVDSCEVALKNVVVHHNKITQSGAAAAGLDASADRDKVWTSWGNRFYDNTYILSEGARFRWQTNWLTYQEWKLEEA